MNNPKISKPKPFLDILSSAEHRFSNVFVTIRQQARVMEFIKRSLPANIGDHCVGCVRKGKTLLVYTDSSLWASQIRLYGNTIIKKTTESIPSMGIETVSARVMPDKLTRRDATRTAKIPSNSVVGQLRNSAGDLQDDALKNSLLSLANSMAQKNSKDLS